MEHSLIATALLENLNEVERVIALAAADKYVLHEHEDLAVLAGVQKALALRNENFGNQLRIQLKEMAAAQKKSAEYDAQINILRDAYDAINEKLIDFGSKLIVEKSQRKKQQSEAGVRGARVKNKDTDALKVWALERAEKLHGNDKTKAKALFKAIPDELKDASNDPERLIYEALLAARKEGKLKRQASHT